MRNVAILNRPGVYLQITRYEMTQSLCKRDAKSESHPGTILAPARVSYQDDFFISYRVYIMTGSFHISLFEGTLHVDKVHLSLIHI